MTLAADLIVVGGAGLRPVPRSQTSGEAQELSVILVSKQMHGAIGRLTHVADAGTHCKPLLVDDTVFLQSEPDN